MRPCLMRYAGFTWRHNPKTLRFFSQENSVTLLPPFSKPDVSVFSEKPFEIAGTGELIGHDCIEQYHRLKTLFSQHPEGLLSIEGLGTFKAAFLSLQMDAEPQENLLSYSFLFKEKKSEKVDVTEERFVEAGEDQTLWDIAEKYGKTIESIIALNPQIRFFDELDTGERVRVC